MTQDEIIDMARQAGFDWSGKELTWEDVICTEEIEAFAKLVAKHERESCAELCECSHDYSKGNFNYHATLIRARGKA